MAQSSPSMKLNALEYFKSDSMEFLLQSYGGGRISLASLTLEIQTFYSNLLIDLYFFTKLHNDCPVAT